MTPPRPCPPGQCAAQRSDNITWRCRKAALPGRPVCRWHDAHGWIPYDVPDEPDPKQIERAARVLGLEDE